MDSEKYTAVWVSHSSISDFLKCPRAYYLNNVYRDPKTNHKITLMQPSLALGQAVHSVVESLSVLPTEKRFEQSLLEKFQLAWKGVSGERGGFLSSTLEDKYKERGAEMIRRVMKNPGPLKNKAVKIQKDLPNFWLSKEDGIILCGKIDWLEYLPESDSVHIIDFKTGKYDENPDSLQLPIYYLLARNCQGRNVAKASYWYLERNDELTSVQLPDELSAQQRVLEIAKKIKTHRQLSHFKCPTDGCQACSPFEKIISGKARYVGVNEYNQDIYILGDTAESEESVIL